FSLEQQRGSTSGDVVEEPLEDYPFGLPPDDAVVAAVAHVGSLGRCPARSQRRPSSTSGQTVGLASSSARAPAAAQRRGLAEKGLWSRRADSGQASSACDDNGKSS